MRIELVDKSKTPISATFFNKAVDKFSFIKEGKSYLFSGGKITIANKKFSSLQNDFQIDFDQFKTEVIEVENDSESEIECILETNLVTISEIENIKQSVLIDLVAIVTDC